MLALSRWVEDGTAILVTGPTGSGKSWLACALAQYACRRGHWALYLRVPRLAEELRLVAHEVDDFLEMRREVLELAGLPRQQLADDGNALLGRLTLAVHGLGHSLTNRPVVIDERVADLGER